MNDFTQPNGALLATDHSTRSPTAAAPLAWTMNDKIKYFRQLPPVLCPASPPLLESPLMTEEEARVRSRQRVERMTRRLAGLPLYHARHLINLVSTQLKGPFDPGSKHWGMMPPIATEAPIYDQRPLNPEYSTRPHIPVPQPHAGPSKKPITPSKQKTSAPFRFAAPVPPLVCPATVPGPSSTIISGPASPATPPPVFPVDLDLAPVKASASRPSIPIDDDRSSLARSPTPTPSMPPPSRTASQIAPTPRPPETPASQRAFIQGLTQASSRASRSGSQIRRTIQVKSPKGLKKYPTTGQLGSKHSTPVRRPCSRAPSESKDSSPLMRFSQRPGLVARGPSRGSQLPVRLSQGIHFSQRESTREEFYNSQLNFDHQIQDITAFMEDDIRS